MLRDPWLEECDRVFSYLHRKNSEWDDNIKTKFLDILREHSGFIAIDGFSGAGKTTLSEYIFKNTDISALDTDSFLAGQKDGRYFSRIHLDKLSKVAEWTIRKHKKIVIAGCQSSRICRLIGNHDILNIYLAKYTSLPHDPWNPISIDEYDTLISDRSVGDLIDEVIESRRHSMELNEKGEFNIKTTALSVDYEGLETETIRYHREHIPHRNCDILMRRIRLNGDD